MASKPDSAPERIFLQWSGTDEPPSPNDCAPRPGDVTWCVDRQFDSDIEYVRVTKRKK